MDATKKLESGVKCDDFENIFRAIFKTRHSRMVFLSLKVIGTDCIITDCFYADRSQLCIGSERYNIKPLKLKTYNFSLDKILTVIEAELDKKFYDMEFIQNEDSRLTLDEYLHKKTDLANKNYRFLIMVGDRKGDNTLPLHLRTRLKNKFHRSVYLELAYYKDGQGVVKHCCYYDRKYKRRGISITPPKLVSCFFPYSCKGILNLVNNEICCDFTHILVADGIDAESSTTPLCGAI